jgi:ADP-ribosylglycohydrolase
MALALADSLAANHGSNLIDQLKRYLRWWQEGDYSVIDYCFDIGTSTRNALSIFAQTGNAPTTENLPADRSSGNGSIMRLAPIPIFYGRLFPVRLHELADHAAKSSRTTHPSPICISACRYMALVLAAFMHGMDRSDVLSADWTRLKELARLGPLDPAIQEVADGSYRVRQPPEIKGSGYVARSLEAALWAFHKAGDFREAVLKAVNLGDDADTTGAVCGQLAGAYWGESGIPDEWRNGLEGSDVIERYLTGLLAASLMVQ